jgi:hypothetical protein
MDNNILVRDNKHEGKYIAFRSIVDRTIVAEGDNPDNVMRDAKKAGCDHPMIMYVPEKNMTCCY